MPCSKARLISACGNAVCPEVSSSGFLFVATMGITELGGVELVRYFKQFHDLHFLCALFNDALIVSDCKR